MTSVWIVGAGSIGGYVAWQLDRAGNELHLAVRTPFDRLRIEAGGQMHEVRGAVHREPPPGASAEWVVLATKAHQTPTAAPWLRALCGPATKGVVVMQNGVDHAERLRPYLDQTPIIPCIVSCAAEVIEPGLVRHHGFSTFELDDVPGAERFVELFAGTDASVFLSDDFTTAAWRKLISNVTISPITAISGRRVEVMANPSAQRLAVALARECIAVAIAEGAKLEPSLAEQSGRGASGGGFGSSMLYDRLAGRELEHEALTGAVLRAAAKHAIAVPHHEVIYDLLCCLSKQA